MIFFQFQSKQGPKRQAPTNGFFFKVLGMGWFQLDIPGVFFTGLKSKLLLCVVVMDMRMVPVPKVAACHTSTSFLGRLANRGGAAPIGGHGVGLPSKY